MEASEADNNTVDTPLDSGQDNFSHENAVGPDVSAERRLHLQSFDYWLTLKGDRGYPLFSDLRAEDLAPFKAHSLLLEFTNQGVIVRFVGDVIKELVTAPLEVGSYLADYPDCGFSAAMIDQFNNEDGRKKAAEFEFLEDNIVCRGMMLPFSSDGLQPNFIMVTASFRHQIKKPEEQRTIPENDNSNQIGGVIEDGEQTAEMQDIDASDTSSFDSLVERSADLAGSISHKDQQNRLGLYEVLSRAYEIFEQSKTDIEAYQALLKKYGLKQQVRAPFTPALKMVFGKNHDKTRITEYAAALSSANRKGILSSDLVKYLLNIPGGIKGCVQEEREYKRQQSGTPAHNRQQEAIEALRQKKAKPLKDITSDDEFCLVLARRKSGGGVEVLGCANTGKATLDSAIRQLASSDKNKAPSRVTKGPIK